MTGLLTHLKSEEAYGRLSWALQSGIIKKIHIDNKRQASDFHLWESTFISFMIARRSSFFGR